MKDFYEKRIFFVYAKSIFLFSYLFIHLVIYSLKVHTVNDLCTMSVLTPISLLVSLLYIKKINEIVKASREQAKQFNVMKADWCSEETNGGKKRRHKL